MIFWEIENSAWCPSVSRPNAAPEKVINPADMETLISKILKLKVTMTLPYSRSVILPILKYFTKIGTRTKSRPQSNIRDQAPNAAIISLPAQPGNLISIQLAFGECFLK